MHTHANACACKNIQTMQWQSIKTSCICSAAEATTAKSTHAHVPARVQGAQPLCAYCKQLVPCSHPFLSPESLPVSSSTSSSPSCHINLVSSGSYVCDDFWVYNVSGPYSCPQDCSGHGVCEWGFCMCDKGFKDIDCSVCRH